jgi:hypothetical protein
MDYMAPLQMVQRLRVSITHAILLYMDLGKKQGFLTTKTLEISTF